MTESETTSLLRQAVEQVHRNNELQQSMYGEILDLNRKVKYQQRGLQLLFAALFCSILGGVYLFTQAVEILSRLQAANASLTTLAGQLSSVEQDAQTIRQDVEDRPRINIEPSTGASSRPRLIIESPPRAAIPEPRVEIPLDVSSHPVPARMSPAPDANAQP